MTAELVAKLGKVDYCGERPCVPQDIMAQLAIAIEKPRRQLVQTITDFLRKHHGKNPSFRTS